MVAYRSWSQLNEYERCPHAYYLARIARAWKKPAAWLPMGSAVHEAAEMWELSGRKMERVVARALFKEAYARETNQYLEKTPNTDFWESSGPYRGPDDITRRYTVGQQHVENYIGYYVKHPEEKPYVLANGRKAIELPFRIKLGGVEVRGVIDAVMLIDGTLVVRDNKTGAKPGGPDQLRLYEIVLLEHLNGIGAHTPTTAGDYFMTKTGKPTVRYNLAQITREEMDDRFRDLEAGIQAEQFPAKPSLDNCARCSVRSSCEFATG